MNAQELHDYLKRHNNGRSGRYLLSVDTESGTTSVWLSAKQKDLAYRLTAKTYGTGVAEHISLSEARGEDGWEIFRWSQGDEELDETDPALEKLLDAHKPKQKAV